MNGSHDIRNPHVLRYLLNKKELNELYISTILRTLAFSMIGIFVPLFLFKELNYSLNYIVYFYLIYSIAFLISTPVASFVNKHLGFKHTITISMPLYILYFGLLYMLEDNPNLFILVPLIYGVAEGLFWLAFHIDFCMYSDGKERGKQLGKYYSFSLLAGLVGPLIGGVILTFSDFSTLFIIVSILIIGSSIPLLLSKDHKKKIKHTWNFFNAGSKRDFISYCCVGARGVVETVFWPIFIFSILNMYMAMGSLFTLLGIASLVTTFVIGKLTDVFNKRTLVKWFSILHAGVWIFKIFITTRLELIGASLFSSSTVIGLDLPYSAIMYNKTHKRVEYLMFREFGLCVGRIVVLLLILATGSIWSSFVYASISSLGYMLL